jgi:hypothetical protein
MDPTSMTMMSRIPFWRRGPTGVLSIYPPSTRTTPTRQRGTSVPLVDCRVQRSRRSRRSRRERPNDGELTVPVVRQRGEQTRKRHGSPDVSPRITRSMNLHPRVRDIRGVGEEWDPEVFDRHQQRSRPSSPSCSPQRMRVEQSPNLTFYVGIVECFVCE